MKLKIYSIQNGMKQVGYCLELGFGCQYDGSVSVPEELNDIKEMEKLAIEDAMDKDVMVIRIKEEDEE